MPGSGHRRGRPPGPTRDRAERREELLDAATAAIRRQGGGASMVDIATEAGITKPILYSHFGDKAGLVGGLAERVAVALNAELATELSRAAKPRDRVAATIGAFVDFIGREPQLYRFLVRGAVERSDAKGPDLVGRIAGQIALVLGTALRSTGADSGPAELWAHAIIGAVFFGAQRWRQHPTLTRDQVVEDLTRLVWDGLAASGLGDVDPDLPLPPLPS